VFCGIAACDHVAELVLYVIGEVWRVRDVNSAAHGRHLQYRILCSRRVSRAQLARFNHGIQNLIAPRSRRLELVVRIVAIGTANQTREKRRFGERQVRNVFVEVSARGFTKAVDREARLLAHVDLIAIKLKDLFFTEARLEDDRHVCLGRLATPRLFRREQKIFDELLRDARTTLPRDR